VDGYIQTEEDAKGLLFYITLMGVVLIAEVFSQFYFVYWSNWLDKIL
jgi:hypothetical protein